MTQKIKPDELIKIGQNIKKLRNDRGLSQDEVAEKMRERGINISRGSFSKIELGILSVSATNLEVIKDILGTTYEALFEHTQQVPDLSIEKGKT